MYILGIESTTNVASVAISNEKNILANLTINTNKTHSHTLLNMVNDICEYSQIKPQDIDYIAISKGPGSYTGLRIGGAIAKGISLGIELQYNKEIKIAEVSTLKALAYNGVGYDGIICSLIDARADRAFCGIYSCENEDKLFEDLIKEGAMSLDLIVDKINELKKEVCFIGDINILEPYLDRLQVIYRFAKKNQNLASASSICMLSYDLIKEEKLTKTDDFKPQYHALTQAERQSMRLLEEKDIEEVALIEKECIKMPWSKEGFLEAYKNDNYIFVVSNKSKQIVGYAGLYISVDEASITNVAVLENFRRIGVAKNLLEYLIEEAKKRGVKKFFLEVRKSNEKAIALYEKCGFVRIGQRKGFYRNPQEDAYLYRYDI